jgi:hypothetical protein
MRGAPGRSVAISPSPGSRTHVEQPTRRRREPRAEPGRGAKLTLVGEIELRRVREIALALPKVNERLSHGAPCFFVRDKRPLCYFHDDDFDERGRVSLMCPAGPGVAEAFVAAAPRRFYRPATSARGVFSDWLGLFLDDSGDDRVDWDHVASIIEDAYRVIAPKRLVARLDDR